MSTAQLKSIAAGWQTISPILKVPQTEADYSQLVTLVDELTDEVGEDESHPLASLMDVAGTLIEGYENRNVPSPASS